MRWLLVTAVTAIIGLAGSGDSQAKFNVSKNKLLPPTGAIKGTIFLPSQRLVGQPTKGAYFRVTIFVDTSVVNPKAARPPVPRWKPWGKPLDVRISAAQMRSGRVRYRLGAVPVEVPVMLQVKYVGGWSGGFFLTQVVRKGGQYTYRLNIGQQVAQNWQVIVKKWPG